jgi:serine/threonine protein kinase
LLGRWSIRDRSTVISEAKPSFEEHPITTVDQFGSMFREIPDRKRSMNCIDECRIVGTLKKTVHSVVTIVEDEAQKVKFVVKTLLDERETRCFERESTIHTQLNHPLILGFETCIPKTRDRDATIVTEFIPNGTLSDHLRLIPNLCENVMIGETRIAIIIVGIVLSMRYLHWKGIIHLDLRPATIFVDWDWTVRIGGFSHAVMSNQSQIEVSFNLSNSVDSRYAAPECFKNAPTQESDVFSFGLILYEVLLGQPGFPFDLTPRQLMMKIVRDKDRPVIPDFVHPDVRALIRDCWAHDPNERPSFCDILSRMDGMDFQITPGVKSSKVRRFADKVKARERILGIAIEDSD